MRYMPQSSSIPGMGKDLDDNFKEAVEVVVQYDHASASLLQRRLAVGYARAARLIDQLEAAGVLGPAEGSKPREVLIHSPNEILKDIPSREEPKDEDLLEKAVKVVIQYDRSSASLLQRRLSIGYARAARLIDELEEIGVVGPAHGADPREVLIKSYEEFVEKRKEVPKEKKKNVFETPPNYSVTKSLIGSSSGWFERVYFWIKVIKVSAVIFIPYWLFGFQIALLVGLILVCLLLSKISLTVQDIHKGLKQL
jgi:Ftsk gamma domain